MRDPTEGKMALSLRSQVSTCLSDDFSVWPECSLTANAVVRLSGRSSRQTPSHATLCCICGPDTNDCS